MRYSQLRWLLLTIFFLGGVSALIYEVTWVRLLSLDFGVSVYAVSAVLTAFMGGLALGSWLCGHLATRISQPAPGRPQDAGPLLRLYAALQVGIAICALLAPVVFEQLAALYVAIYHQLEPGFYAFNLIRFGLATLVLLVPTSLMGGTLPAMSQVLARSERDRGGALGALYAANTFGGVVGVCLAGLVLIRLLGVHATIYLAAAIDLLTAGGALALSTRALRLADDQRRAAADHHGRRAESREPARANQRVRPGTGNREPKTTGHSGTHLAPRTTQRASRMPGRPGGSPQPATAEAATTHPVPPSIGQARLVLWGFALSGFTALGYEVVWTRLLAIFTLNAVFSFTIMLTTFLIGLAVGGALAARRIDRAAQPLEVFGYVQLSIGVCAVLVLFVFAKLPTLREWFIVTDTFGKQVLAEFFTAGITMFVPTVLMGATFPVAARIYGSGTDAVGERVGRLYALNTVGAMIGACTAGFVLIPLLGLQRAALTLALLNLALGSAALLTLTVVPRLRLGAALAVAIVAAALLPPGIYLGFREGAPPALIFYREGIDATVAVFRVQDPPLKISFVNGRSEVPTDPQSMRAFYLLGHLPPLLHPQARSALVISFGNGIAAGAMSRHGIPRIQAVELVAEQVEAAQLYREENRNVLDYPGLQIAIEDGRNYLQRSAERFDIITADATHPINTSSWALFTREFYTLVRQRLVDDGVFVQWVPFHDLAKEDYRAIVKTFQSVFPHTSLWYTGGTHSFLVATPQRLTRADIAALDARIQAAGIADDLGSGAQLATDFLMDEDGVSAYTAGAPIVTDDTAFFIPAKDMTAILQSFGPYAQIGQAQP